MEVEHLAARVVVLEMAVARLSQQIALGGRPPPRDVEERIVKALAKSGGMTDGILCNRLRPIMQADIQRALNKLLAEGVIVQSEKINRYNKTKCFFWSVATP